MQPIKFLIIATGFNCKKYALKCIKSVQAQTYKNFTAVFISDGSTDGTLDRDSLKSVNDERLTVCIYPQNEGAAKRRWNAIKMFCYDEETVVILLGLDDELFPNCLERLAMAYKTGVWMSYGNWRDQHRQMLPKDFKLYFDEETHANRDYRKVKYRSTAPNSFKRFLFDQLKEEDFQIDGKWIDTTTESPLMFACLEMCGKEKIAVIEEPIYLYNQFLPGGTLRRLGVDYKYKVYNTIINREKKPKLIR